MAVLLLSNTQREYAVKPTINPLVKSTISGNWQSLNTVDSIQLAG